jgi:hypothetical protein
MYYKIRSYMLPDNNDIYLLRDFNSKVELATFLDDSNILVKIADRFMVFDEHGEFKDEAEFKDMRESIKTSAN